MYHFLENFYSTFEVICSSLRLSVVAKIDVSFHPFTSKIPFLRSNRDIKASKTLDGSIYYEEKCIQTIVYGPYCSHMYGQQLLFLYIAKDMDCPGTYMHVVVATLGMISSFSTLSLVPTPKLDIIYAPM